LSETKKDWSIMNAIIGLVTAIVMAIIAIINVVGEMDKGPSHIVIEKPPQTIVTQPPKHIKVEVPDIESDDEKDEYIRQLLEVNKQHRREREELSNKMWAMLSENDFLSKTLRTMMIWTIAVFVVFLIFIVSNMVWIFKLSRKGKTLQIERDSLEKKALVYKAKYQEAKDKDE
jgi:hypothetical protein